MPLIFLFRSSLAADKIVELLKVERQPFRRIANDGSGDGSGAVTGGGYDGNGQLV
jgi:hypothetical protein